MKWIALIAVVPWALGVPHTSFPPNVPRINGFITFESEGVPRGVYGPPRRGGGAPFLIGGVWDHEWSPDGRRVAAVDARGLIVGRVRDAKNHTVVPSDSSPWPGEWFADPTWSPDGSMLAFTAFLDGWQGLFVTDSGGTLVRRIATDVSGSGEWAPNGRAIAFAVRARMADRWQTDVALIAPDGSWSRLLTSTPHDEGSPTWSPDGQWLAFTRADSSRLPDIWVMRADGSGERQLTNDPAADFQPAWSPDGAIIAFASNRDGNSEIYAMNADGTAQMNLTRTVTDERSPEWLAVPPCRTAQPVCS